MINSGGSQWRGQMLQSGGLEPSRHDCIPSVARRTCIVQSPAAGVIIQSSRRSIALLHLATHVALRSSLRSQFQDLLINASNTKHNHNQITRSPIQPKQTKPKFTDPSPVYSQCSEKSNSKQNM